MKARVDAGTDIAMLGAWDAGAQDVPDPDAPHAAWMEEIGRRTARGELYVIHTGGDGGGPIEVFVDEPIPEDLAWMLVPAGNPYLLRVPSGQLLVGGMEQYRLPFVDVARVDVPPGTYSVQCLEFKEDEGPMVSDAELEQVVGKADLAYYQSRNQRGCAAGFAMLLLFPILWYPLGWIAALAITIVACVAWFPVLEWVHARDQRYRQLDVVISEYRRVHEGTSLVLVLSTISDSSGMSGGSVHLRGA